MRYPGVCDCSIAITAPATIRTPIAWTRRCSKACSSKPSRPAMVEELRTERLVLRRARRDDAEAMHRIMSNPVAMRYWSSPPHQAFEETARWMASMVEAPREVSDDFIVTLDGELIGKFGAWRLPEFGFLIDPAQWGKGYASEAMRGFIAHRRRVGGTELTADVDPRNV